MNRYVSPLGGFGHYSAGQCWISGFIRNIIRCCLRWIMRSIISMFLLQCIQSLLNGCYISDMVLKSFTVPVYGRIWELNELFHSDCFHAWTIRNNPFYFVAAQPKLLEFIAELFTRHINLVLMFTDILFIPLFHPYAQNNFIYYSREISVDLERNICQSFMNFRLLCCQIRE